ncbi:MAG: DUF2752 domain-containing protein, partial [Candidatus Kapabacteria bacterium]|nr:DUF2752 domain-containing protein [Candidatus Kapabacteria bacterium]
MLRESLASREQRNAVIAIGAVAAFVCVVYLFNPGNYTFIPCWFHTLTGYECAGCGLTRSAHALMHGDAEAAWRFNRLSV